VFSFEQFTLGQGFSIFSRNMIIFSIAILTQMNDTYLFLNRMSIVTKEALYTAAKNVNNMWTLSAIFHHCAEYG